VLAKLFLIALLAQPVPTLPAIPSPTPVPSSTPRATMSSPLDQGEVYDFLATAAANTNSLPDDIFSPGGISLVSADSGSADIFGYGKWLFSGTSTMELLGRKLSPIGTHLFAAIGVVVILASVYLLVNLITLLIKGVVWLVQQVLKFIPFVG
jgi:hypothetical protein